MLRVTQGRVTAGTAACERRGCCPKVWKTSREGGWINTHTIDERWEAFLLHRVEVGISECSEAWSARGGNGERRGREVGYLGNGVVTPSMDIARPPGGGAAPKPEAKPRAAAPEGTTIAPLSGERPPRAPRTGAHRKGELGIAPPIGIIGIGIGIAASICTSRDIAAAREPPSGLPSAQVHLSDTANPPESGERREKPPTPSLTSSGQEPP